MQNKKKIHVWSKRSRTIVIKIRLLLFTEEWQHDERRLEKRSSHLVYSDASQEQVALNLISSYKGSNLYVKFRNITWGRARFFIIRVGSRYYYSDIWCNVFIGTQADWCYILNNSKILAWLCWCNFLHITSERNCSFWSISISCANNKWSDLEISASNRLPIDLRASRKWYRYWRICFLVLGFHQTIWRWFNRLCHFKNTLCTKSGFILINGR